ncbi:hypothetical protein [Streptomyces tubercidicus]|uniref:hypothetical protein n=1 Tax=Streptomyces tubercidicus TaxID=47759 RepID=UPI0034662222
MTSTTVTSEVRELADALVGADSAIDQIVHGLLALHHTEHDAEQLGSVLPRLAGEESVLRLIALVVEAKADSKPVQDLDASDRHAAKAALHTLTADLDRIADRADADKAAWHLDPA